MSEARHSFLPSTCSGLAHAQEQFWPALVARCVLSSTRLSPTSAILHCDGPLLARNGAQLGIWEVAATAVG